MTLWLIRAGSRGEHEQKFLDESRVYVASDYLFEAAGPNPCYHWRSINWFSGLIPLTVFPQDLLYSFGAFMTICRIQRNDAEARVKSMASRS